MKEDGLSVGKIQKPNIQQIMKELEELETMVNQHEYSEKVNVWQLMNNEAKSGQETQSICTGKMFCLGNPLCLL